MRRRNFLYAGAGVLGIGFAGCSEEGGPDATPTEPETDSTLTESAEPGTDATPTESAVSLVDQADEALTRAGEEIEAEAAKFEDESLESSGIDVRTATIYDYLDTADGYLDEAEAVATEDISDEIQLRRDYIEFTRDLTDLMDVFAEAFTLTMNGFTYLENSRYADGTDELEDAQERFSDTNDKLVLAKDSFEDIDWDQIEGIESVEETKIRDSFEQLESILPTLTKIVEGMIYFARATEHLQKGDEELNSEDLDAAKSEFGSAASEYDRALSIFREQEDEAPDNLKSSLIELTCFSEALRDASQKYADAIGAYQSGNDEEGDSLLDEAESALDRCSW
jgi:tetratricopeptide (TPR) repeat protein